MLKLFYMFLTKRLLGSYKKETIFNLKLLILNSLKFNLAKRSGLNYLSLILFLSLLLFAASCNTTEPPIIPPPPPDLRKITLTFEDASCTEVWLNIKVDSLTLPVELTLKQYNPTGDSLSQIFVLNTQDTVLYIDSLSPNQTYNYQAILSTDTTIKSEKVTVQTLETTSHNFTWQSWTFGQQSSSVLYDVAIIDENNIWAVGEIYTEDSYTYDSLGNWIDPYNAVHWNGNNWELVRIYYNYNGSNTWSPIRTILAFSSNDIWFSAGIHWNGINFITKPMNINFPYLINKMWGTSSSDFYIVGNSGSMAHYNGTTWTQIESGTTLHLTDIYGDSKGNIYAAGVNISEVKGVLLKGNYQNNFSPMIYGEIINQNELFQKLYGELSSVWIDNNNTIYTGGNLLYNYKNNQWDYVRSLPENYIGGNPGTYYRGFIYSIRGNANNDYVIAGDRNTLKHFNGLSWQQIGLSYNPSSPIIWFSVNVKNNTIVAAGTENGKAKVILLKKY